jgi:type IV conjugative transfer system coupling protein TraD
MNTHSGNITRGGQIWAHNLRMLSQIIKLASALAAIAPFLWFLGALMGALDFKTFYMYIMNEWAQCKLGVGAVFYGAKYKQIITITFYDFWNSQWHTWNAANFVSHSVVMNMVRETKIMFTSIFSPQSIIYVFAFSVGVFFSALSFFYLRGRKSRSKKMERGNEIVTPSVLRNILRMKKLASDFKVGSLPLVKGKETSHMMISGTTGAGKSNFLHSLIPQIRQKGQKMVIVDLTGEYVERYYRPEVDIILNPYDKRSELWSPWAECVHESDYDTLAETIVGTNNKSYDPFWETAGKLILSESLRLSHNESQSPRISELVETIATIPLREFSQKFKGTKAAALVDEKGEKTTISIRSTLVSKIACFEKLKDTEQGFSVKGWIKQKNDSCLFLTAKPSQRASLRPLLSAWMNCAIDGLMDMTPDNERRVWIVVDELPALQKLPSLSKGLAELRKYGGCIVSGFQDVPQLTALYGRDEAQTLLNQHNTKLFFRSTDPETCQYISRALGQKEETETKENLSYGANTIRDGVSLNEIRKIENLVLPTEVSQLEDLSCYVKLPGDFPITKVTMRYKKPEARQPAFLDQLTLEGKGV